MKRLVLLSKFLIALSAAISLFWSISASVLDIQHEYCYARGIADFIKQYDLDQYKILLTWDIDETEDGESYENYADLVELSDSHHYGVGIEAISYFDENIFMNVNADSDYEPYQTLVKASSEDNQESFEIWKEKGLPYGKIIIAARHFFMVSIFW